MKSRSLEIINFIFIPFYLKFKTEKKVLLFILGHIIVIAILIPILFFGLGASLFYVLFAG